MAQKKISYNQAVAEIENILSVIENNQLDVDNLADKVKRVEQLLKICKQKLQSTEKDVENILESIADQ